MCIFNLKSSSTSFCCLPVSKMRRQLFFICKYKAKHFFIPRKSFAFTALHKKKKKKITYNSTLPLNCMRMLQMVCHISISSFFTMLL